MIKAILACLIGYLLGSIATGILIGKKAGVDPRTIGSKSTGATNVTRTLGLPMGALTFLGDAVKGLLACIACALLFGRSNAMLGGLFAVIGHNWPLYHHFRGGKGVSTSIAVLLFFFPWQAAAAILLCLAVIALFRYVSMGSMTLLASAAALCLLTRPLMYDGLLCLALLALCIWRHRSNIDRLIHGTENKFQPAKKR